MMPNKSIYRDADAAEINLYELNFARFFSIQTSENGWRRVVCELVRRAAKGTKELRLEDGTELPGEKTFPDYVVDLMDSYLAVLPDAKPHAYPAAEREQLMERHCRHTEDGGIDYDYYQDMTLDTFIFNEFFARGGYKYFSTEIDDLAVWFASYGADTLSDCYKYGVGVPQSFHQAALWEQYAINLYYIYRDYYNKSDDESYRDSRLDEIGRLSVSCHIQRNLPDALYTDEQWGCISDFGCMPTELVALSRAEKPDTPYISHTSSLVMQMIQKTSLEELKQMGHTYLNYVRRNSSKNPLEDWKQAVNYYYAGAAQGDAECAAAVGYCCEMDPRGSNLPLALAWYQHAAKAGSAWAMEKVATFYEEGYGCTANRALADACRETLKYMR